MEASSNLAPGTVPYVAERLWLWARRTEKGFAHVEFMSEVARREVMHQLREKLAQTNTPLHEVTLSRHSSPLTLVQDLLEQLQKLKPGVVSINGFERTFLNGRNYQDLVYLNFNREKLAAPLLRQIWWLTPTLVEGFLRGIPDLDSWFMPRLNLREVRSEPLSPFSSSSPTQSINIDDARRRSSELRNRLERAIAVGASEEDQASLARAAVSALVEAGALQEAKVLIQSLPEKLLAGVTSEFARRGTTLTTQGLYSEAEPLLVQALQMQKRLLGEEHSDVAASLNNLAALYKSQGRYDEAEMLFVQVLAMSKRLLGEGHLDVAISLNNLAVLYDLQGRYEEAEPLLVQALEMIKRLLGEEHPDVAQSINNLAVLYDSQGRYDKAEPLYMQALEMKQRLLSEEHPSVANSLNNLAGLYKSQGRYEEAELLLVQALKMRQRLLGEEHPDVATSLNNLAVLYDSQGRYEEVEPLLVQALKIVAEKLGPEHPNATTICQRYLDLLSNVAQHQPAVLERLLSVGSSMTKQLLKEMRTGSL